jgi:hypothetical protein
MAGLPQINRFQAGLVTQRNPLNSPFSIVGMNVVTHYDALIDGLNTEVSNFNTLIRRYGFTAFSANSLSEQPDNIDVFVNITGVYRTMVDTSGHLYWVNAGTFTPIIAKSGTGTGRFATVGNWMYYADGSDNLKWDGTHLWNWGIVAPTVAPTLQFNAQANSTYVTTAQFNPTTELFSGSLVVTIGGTPVTYGPYTNQSLTAIATNINAGTQITASLVQPTITVPPLVPQYLQLKSSTPGLPGVMTISSTISDTTNPGTAFTLVPGQLVGTNSGLLMPLISYSWVYVYRNSVTGHISTASPPTNLIPQQIAGQAILSGPGSTDPQVDTIEIYRTQDGGSSYFLVGTVNNTLPNWIFTDNITDSPEGFNTGFLNTQIIAPIAFANAPPQAGATDPVWHTDRIFYHVGNTLYYTGGAEVTNGVPSECSPPANFFTYPGQIVKKISTSNGLLVFLADNVHLLTGLDLSSYYSQLFAINLGIGNPNAAVYDGQTLYVYNSKRQLYAISTSKTTETGFAIGDLLKKHYDPALTCLTLHRGDSTDYALYVSNGVDRFHRYYPDGNSWSPVAKPLMSCGIVKSVTTAPGLTQMMLLPATPTASVYQVFYRNTSLNSDNLIPYTASATVGSIILGQAGAKQPTVEQIGTNARLVGSLFGLSLRTDEVAGNFEPILSAVDDPINDPSTTLYTKRWYLKNTNNPINQSISNIQLKFDWIAEDFPNELYGFYLWGSK